MTKSYDDMLHLTRPVSGKYPPISRSKRAAQFSSFAALTGYDEAIDETARHTEVRHELTEDEQDALNRALSQLARGSTATFTYFLPDAKKDGGAYLATTAVVKEIDLVHRILRFADGQKLPLDDICAILPRGETE